MITLGSYRVGDLKADYFQNLFYNSVFWALGYEVPEKGVLSAGNNFKMVKESSAYKPAKKSIPAPPDFDGGDEYVDYKIAASGEAAGLGWELAFTDTDISGGDDLSDGRVIFTVSKSL